MTTAQLFTEQLFVLCCVDWASYVGFGDLLGDRHVRLTYDRGAMEFRTLSPEHERAKQLLARLLEALTEELDIDIAGYGSMTCRRQDLERGLEPDECFWIANEARVRGRDTIELGVDPPPDLALEVEISRSALNRLRLYASLGVPEVWRWDGSTLRIGLLTAAGTYADSPRSRSFPFLPIAEFVGFVTSAGEESDTKLVRRFRAWVRERQSQGCISGSGVG